MESKSQMDKVDVSRSATDILNPNVNVVEDKPSDPALIPPLSPDDLSAEDHQEAARAKQEFYEQERQAREAELNEEVEEEEDEKGDGRVMPKAGDQNVSRSQMDKGQEAQLDPQAQRQLAESQAKARLEAQKQQEAQQQAQKNQQSNKK